MGQRRRRRRQNTDSNNQLAPAEERSDSFGSAAGGRAIESGKVSQTNEIAAEPNRAKRSGRELQKAKGRQVSLNGRAELSYRARHARGRLAASSEPPPGKSRPQARAAAGPPIMRPRQTAADFWPPLPLRPASGRPRTQIGAAKWPKQLAPRQTTRRSPDSWAFFRLPKLAELNSVSCLLRPSAD